MTSTGWNPCAGHTTLPLASTVSYSRLSGGSLCFVANSQGHERAVQVRVAIRGWVAFSGTQCFRKPCVLLCSQESSEAGTQIESSRFRWHFLPLFHTVCSFHKYLTGLKIPGIEEGRGWQEVSGAGFNPVQLNRRSGCLYPPITVIPRARPCSPCWGELHRAPASVLYPPTFEGCAKNLRRALHLKGSKCVIGRRTTSMEI